jgi:intracellular septation protein
MQNSQQHNKHNSQQGSSESFLKFVCDFLPLAIFFCIYKFSSHPKPIIPATGYLIVATLVSLVIFYIYTKKIAKMPLFSAILLGLFGGLTIFSGNDLFIKMKPTLVNLIFAAILFFGYFTKRPLLKNIFDGAIQMETKHWLVLSLRWACFFLFLALLNELVWRNFDTDFWVKFKVFGMLPISFIFTISQIPYISKATKNFS